MKRSKNKPWLSPAWRMAVFVRASWALARAKPLAAIAASGLMMMLLVALLADVIATHDPLQQTVRILQSPSAGHYFGTDDLGRDVFSRVVHGARSTLFVGFLALALATVSGVAIGTVSAYRGGAFDLLAQRFVDVFLGFPFLVAALIIVVALGPSSTSAAFAIALALAPQIARLSRAAVLSTKEEGYVEAARASGAGPARIIWRHLLPNSFPPILAQITGYLGTAVVAETALSFLRLGVPPPDPSWGRMLQEGVQQYFEVAPWATIFPGLALAITVLSAALLGDQLRELLGAKEDTQPKVNLEFGTPTQGSKGAEPKARFP
jgi:peptide/nickel transport system permease protein